MPVSPMSFEIVGLEATLKALEQLPTHSMKKNAVRNALKKSSVGVESSAKNLVPYAPKPKAFSHGKHLRDTIKVSSSLKKSQRGIIDRSRVYMYIGSTASHAHLIEFGTSQRYTKKGAYKGYVSPRPFLRPAWDMNKKRTLNIFSEELWKLIQKSARLLAKKAERGTLTKKQISGLR